MSTVIPRQGGGFRLFTKGASEIILKKYEFLLNNFSMKLSLGLFTSHQRCEIFEPPHMPITLSIKISKQPKINCLSSIMTYVKTVPPIKLFCL